MWMKMLQAVNIDGAAHKKGEVVDVPDGSVKSLLKSGWAVEAAEPTSEPSQPAESDDPKANTKARKGK